LFSTVPPLLIFSASMPVPFVFPFFFTVAWYLQEKCGLANNHMSNINVDSTRKISDCKINALKVKRVLNTLKNLNSSEMTLKMLKMMQIYIKMQFFEVFIVFLPFFIFSENL